MIRREIEGDEIAALAVGAGPERRESPYAADFRCIVRSLDAALASPGEMPAAETRLILREIADCAALPLLHGPDRPEGSAAGRGLLPVLVSLPSLLPAAAVEALREWRSGHTRTLQAEPESGSAKDCRTQADSIVGGVAIPTMQGGEGAGNGALPSGSAA